MNTDTAMFPITTSVLDSQRRALLLWCLALGAVSAAYTSFYPTMGGDEIESLVETMPRGLTEALGYDNIGTAAGYLQSSVYGLLAPVLLLVFAIGSGARLIAGGEQDGSLQLELTAPVSRRAIFAQRLAALWLETIVLNVIVLLVTYALVQILDMDVSATALLAGALPLLLLVLGFGTLALAIGAATGRRSLALAITAGSAVVAFMLNAIGPSAQLDWMAEVSPFGWYLANDPLTDGVDLPGIVRLAFVPAIAAVAGWWAIEHRDLMT